MAGSAVIGSLRVNLGIDTAAFSDGLKGAQSKLKGFGASLRSAIVPLAAAATAALAGIGAAVKGAIDDADDMGKAAQKFGVGVEELSRLNYAAGLADLSLQQLGVALGRLNKNMASAAAGNKATAASFASVGIAVANADGSLRSSDEVLMDLADRFAAMPDGAEKTALAMQLMGKSGADMIPLLNGGGAAIKALGDEADRLGVTVSTETGKAAEQFNDNLTRLQSAAGGLARSLARALLPALVDISEGAILIGQNMGNLHAIAAEVFSRILEAADGLRLGLNGIAANIPQAFIRAFQLILRAAATAFSAVPGSIGEKIIQPMKDASAAFDEFAGEGAASFNNAMANSAEIISGAMRPLESIIAPINAASAALDGMAGSFDGALGGGGGKGGGASSLSEEAQELARSMEELKRRGEQVFEATRTPAEEFGAQMAELNKLVQAGAIDWDTYRRATIQAQDALAEAGKTGKGVFRNFADDFGDAVAGVIDGTTSISDAFARMVNKMAGDMIASGISDVLTSVLSGIRGGFGNPLSAVPWLSGARALGGPVGAGKAYLVGERGPEFFVPHSSGTILPNGSGGRGGDVIVNVNNAPAGTTVQESRGADGRRMIEVMVADALESNLARGRHDRALAANFGIRRQAR